MMIGRRHCCATDHTRIPRICQVNVLQRLCQWINQPCSLTISPKRGPFLVSISPSLVDDVGFDALLWFGTQREGLPSELPKRGLLPWNHGNGLPNSAGSNDSLSKIDQFETISDKWSHTINIQCNKESADPCPLSGCHSHVEPTSGATVEAGQWMVAIFYVSIHESDHLFGPLPSFHCKL